MKIVGLGKLDTHFIKRKPLVVEVGLTTKVHLPTDEHGLQVGFVLTAGQTNDCTQAIALLGDRKVGHLLADKSYDANDIVEHVATKGAISVVPPKSNQKVHREYDKDLYKHRNRIERCFSKFKHFRRFATRYENTQLK
jgi:transposase